MENYERRSSPESWTSFPKLGNKQRRTRALATAAVIALGGGLMPVAAHAADTPTQCAAPTPGGPILVTSDCVDSQYNRPVIDSETEVTTPVPLRKVSGHFEGTSAKFNIYLTPKDQWQGRFYQYVYPVGDGNATDQALGFAADSGAYAVQTNGTGGYRLDAAAAKFSETVATKYYGQTNKPIFGYVYGGSGGSYQTIAAAENTTGVWDGAVPFVIGSPTAIPNNFFVRAFARLVLEGKASQIADAVRPGGSGNPHAGLTEAESAVLTEVTKIGVPMRAWDDPRYLLGLDTTDGLLGFAGMVKALDGTYANDFWSKPGYLGTEQSALGDIIRAAKVDASVTIKEVIRDAQNVPTGLVLENLPELKTVQNLDYTVYGTDGAKAGTVTGSLDTASKVFTIAPGNAAATLNRIDPGNKFGIDNRWAIALTSYHRHQVPADHSLTAWDQFRAPDGTPIYPQRARDIGAQISKSVSGGGTFTGKINTKVIVISNLLDPDAFPWHADWYAKRVQGALGKQTDSSFRVWLNDNADHLDGTVIASGPALQTRLTRLVDYNGILEQAVRDVSAWAEKGEAPAASTKYDVEDSQVSVPDNAAVRRGIQPTVDLTANGETRIEVAVGQPVTLSGKIQAPPGAGTVTAAQWDFTGSGTFAPAPIGNSRKAVEVEGTYTYTKPGTYYPILKGISQREGNATTPFGRVQNLDRVRVVVR